MRSLLTTSAFALMLTFPSIPAQAGGKEWCEENIGTCIFLGSLAVITAFAIGSDDGSSDYSFSSDDDDDYVPPPGPNPIDEGLREPLPQADYSAEEGCVWGSRATDTC